MTVPAPWPARTLLGVSLAASDTDAACAAMVALAPLADVIELRLDLIPHFDLARLLAARPRPVVVTYRPLREGGHYRGAEDARLAVLHEAAALGAEVIDIEWDSFAALGDVFPARRMISRHFFNGMPANFAAVHAELAASGAEIVKLVGMAQRLLDVVLVLETLEATTVPTVAIAMGELGVLTRILAPRFYPGAWLTYAAAGAGQAVAPGQIAIQDLRTRYRAHTLTPATPVCGILSATANGDPRLVTLNGPAGDAVWVPCQLAPGEEAAGVRAALARWIDLECGSMGRSLG
jgi:3-dehydroquinate dehydratase/shikimate dehydrogenase